MDKAITFDSILFLLSNLLFLFWISRFKLSIVSKFISFILFLAFNSAYNIMVKRIHDFNIVIPRTFIWNFELFGPFSVYDCVFLFLFIFSFIFLTRKKLIHLLFKYDLIKYIYIRDLIIIIIGSFSFFIFKGYWLDEGRTYLRYMKGLLYFNTTLLVTLLYLNYKFKIKHFVIPISIILINGFVSLKNFPIDEIWVRYGQPIKILSQEDAYSISLFIITYLFLILFLKKEYSKTDFVLFVLLIAFFLQNFLSVYKANYIYFAFLLLILLLLKLNKFQFLIWYFVIYIVIIFVIVNAENIINLTTSQSIDTRFGQIKDYFVYLENREFGRYVIGSGIGSPYESTFDDGDYGEIKIVDKSNSIALGYRFAFQVPIMEVFKSSGLIGIFIYCLMNICIFLFLFKNVFKSSNIKYLNLTDQVELLTISILIIFYSWTNYFMLGGTTPIYIFLGFLCGRFLVLFYVNEQDFRT